MRENSAQTKLGVKQFLLVRRYMSVRAGQSDVTCCMTRSTAGNVRSPCY